MKKKLLLAILALMPFAVFGQKVAYLYSDSVLLSVSGYQQGVLRLDSLRQAYANEINTGIALVQEQYTKLAEPYTPQKNETLRDLKKRMSASDTLHLSLIEKDLTQWQEKRVSYDRMLQLQYAKDIQPLVGRINKVIAEYARVNGLMAVYSMEQMRNMLIYIDPKQNITDLIIRRLQQP